MSFFNQHNNKAILSIWTIKKVFVNVGAASHIETAALVLQNNLVK